MSPSIFSLVFSLKRSQRIRGTLGIKQYLALRTSWRKPVRSQNLASSPVYRRRRVLFRVCITSPVPLVPAIETSTKPSTPKFLACLLSFARKFCALTKLSNKFHISWLGKSLYYAYWTSLARCRNFFHISKKYEL